MWSRREVLFSGLSWSAFSVAAAAPASQTQLQRGGVVVVMRHALAPGTFDPPGFKLGDCNTQRQLSDEGRAQARRIGGWFADQQLRPQRVRSSPWCRCMETATLAFGSAAETWRSLGSPHGGAEADNASAQRALRTALAAVPAGRFEVWVTHNFVISALLGESSASGDAWIARARADGAAEAVARLEVT